MSALRHAIKAVYSTIVPGFVRRSSLVHKMKEKMLGHDWVYDAEYYATRRGGAAASAKTMAESIAAEFKPTKVIDVGCGTGDLLEALQTPICIVFGLEYSEAAVRLCLARGLDVQRFNLELDVFNYSDVFDLAISMEVAEHLPEHCSDRLVGLLTGLAPVVVFTAATPGQGGTDHVNEQPHSYWIEKFRRFDFALADELSTRWRKQWAAAGNVQSWYWKNIMVFTRVQ